jgi:hypothetical protein
MKNLQKARPKGFAPTLNPALRPLPARLVQNPVPLKFIF